MPSERVKRRIERLLDQAEEAADARDWEAVLESVRGVFAVDPANEDATSFERIATAALGGDSSESGLSSGAGGDSAAAKAPVSDGAGAAVDGTAVAVGDSAAAMSGGDVTSSSSSDGAPSPTSFAAGRYVVNRFLGEGGKKRVFLAHDETLDRDVAFALIKTEGLDETSRERVRREAQAMGRMGTHPAIMPIYDLGEEPVAGAAGTQPYMVQPLMAGGDVEGLIEEAEGPLDLETALRIATQTAQGLSFAHSKGIVHRDLKPGNVWLDEDGSAKIGDFGLAVATDRSRLTVEKVMVGTVSYMPPEQATGGDVTPKADLYSLGAMLYEMCTGRVPFMGDDDIAVISQHINTPPVAPSWHNGQVPKTLDSLILRLMSKDPGERPESADEVLAALEAVDLSAAPDEADEKGTGSLDSMAGGVFVGRHREMDQLKATFEEVLSGRGKMVTLVGEPGIGKTRTAQELSTYASMRGAQVLWGRSYEGGGAPPYWPWVQAIRSHVSTSEETALRAQLGSAGPVIAEIVTDIREKLPDLPAPTPIEDPESARFRLFDSISTFLKQASQNAPLVLMLEDLHWADRPSLMLLEFVARELANSKLMIVGNYRDVELNRRHPLAVTLGELTRERLFERVVLRGLQRHDVERFIEIAAGITPPAALVDTVHSQTEGNPLFVTETVRLLIQEGDIASGQTTASGTTSWEVRIPEGVREVIGRRLDRLSERCNEVLTTAAVIGRQFRFAVLLKLVGGDAAGGNGSGSSAVASGSAMSSSDSGSSSPGDAASSPSTTDPITENMLLDALDEALDGRIIEELPEEVGLYQFTHAQMQETLTSELSANRLVRMHARIATALEDYYSNTAPNAGQTLLETNAAELAEHFAEAEVVLGSEHLTKYSVIAGNRALHELASDRALVHFERASAALSPDTADYLQGQIYEGLARSQALSGSQDDAFQSFQAAFERYVKVGDPTAASEVAAYPQHIYFRPEAAQFLERALGVAEPGTIQQAKILSRYGMMSISGVVEYSAAEDSLKQALDIARDANDPILLLWTLGRSAEVDFHHLNLAEGLQTLSEAESLAEQSEDATAAFNTYAIGTGPMFALGRTEEARRYTRNALEAAERTRDRTRLVPSLHNACAVAAASGDWDQSHTFAERLLQVTVDQAFANLLLAWIAFETGETAEGERRFRLARDHDRELSGKSFIDPTGLTKFAVAAAIARVWRSEELLSVVSSSQPMSAEDTTTTPFQSYVRSIYEAMKVVAESSEAGAEEAYAALQAYSMPFSFPLGGIATSRERLLGQLCALYGNATAASSHFDKAIDACRKSGLLAQVAWSCTDHSELLLDRNASDGREKAVALQDEAIAIARELGMKPLLERVLAKREIMRA